MNFTNEIIVTGRCGFLALDKSGILSHMKLISEYPIFIYCLSVTSQAQATNMWDDGAEGTMKMSAMVASNNIE